MVMAGSTIATTAVADESQNSPAHPGDAWLEEALLLAAAELAAFRSSAQTERQRLLQNEEAAHARIAGLEDELRKQAASHAAQLTRAHGTLEEQLREREQAWVKFSDGLRERMSHLAAANERHARDVEEASEL